MTPREFRIKAILIAFEAKLASETVDYNYELGAKHENEKRERALREGTVPIPNSFADVTAWQLAAVEACTYADELTAEAERRGFFDTPGSP